MKFADVVLDIDEVVALVGEMLYLRDGRELVIGEKAKAKYERLKAERDELNDEIDWELAEKEASNAD